MNDFDRICRLRAADMTAADADAALSLAMDLTNAVSVAFHRLDPDLSTEARYANDRVNGRTLSAFGELFEARKLVRTRAAVDAVAELARCFGPGCCTRVEFVRETSPGLAL